MKMTNVKFHVNLLRNVELVSPKNLYEYNQIIQTAEPTASQSKSYSSLHHLKCIFMVV